MFNQGQHFLRDCLVSGSGSENALDRANPHMIFEGRSGTTVLKNRGGGADPARLQPTIDLTKQSLMHVHTLSFIGFLVLVFLLTGCSHKPMQPVTSNVHTLMVGQTTLMVPQHRAPGSDLTYFNMHDDENTSVEAAQMLIARHGGQVVELQHSGGRYLNFMVGADTFRVDPNRIFTDLGIETTLARESTYHPDAHNAVRQFAESLLTILDLAEASIVITLHNNSDENYSALSYLPSGPYAIDAAAVHLEPGADPDDFFFVTDPLLYEAFKKAGFNAVLQDNAQATDDGSLSVYCGQHGLPYVNVEAQHGHVEEQLRMLETLYAYLNP